MELLHFRIGCEVATDCKKQVSNVCDKGVCKCGSSDACVYKSTLNQCSNKKNGDKADPDVTDAECMVIFRYIFKTLEYAINLFRLN